MLKLTSIFVVLSFAWSANAFENEPKSFKGIEWGTSINEIAGMVTIDDAGELKTYQKKNEDVKMENAVLKYLDYFFFRDRFCGAMGVFEEFTNFIEIRDSLFQQHGPGQFIRIESHGEEYNWLGKDVNIILRYDERGNKGTITYIYSPTSNQQRQDEPVSLNRKTVSI